MTCLSSSLTPPCTPSILQPQRDLQLISLCITTFCPPVSSLTIVHSPPMESFPRKCPQLPWLSIILPWLNLILVCTWKTDYDKKKKQTTMLSFKFMTLNFKWTLSAAWQSYCISLVNSFSNMKATKLQNLFLYTLPFLLLIMDKLALFLLKAVLLICILDPTPSNFKLFALKISPLSPASFFSTLKHCSNNFYLKKRTNKQTFS